MQEVGYCCRLIIPPIYSVENGVEAIETILSKAILCRHDVKKINKIFRKIEYLETQSTEIPKFNSYNVLEKIVEKIKQIAAEKNIFGWISLYHLQDFLDKDLHLEKHFSKMWSQVEKNSLMVKEMAAYLTCCHSGQKRGKHKDYPPFFQELLENGYIHLYDHLVHMRGHSNRMNRLSEIKKISFSQLSQIILETRDAIVQKIKNTILNRPSNIVFLVGGTGAGKSTTLCFLKKHQMILENFCYHSKSDQKRMIGNDIATSCTFLPTIEKTDDWIIVDFAGFEDTNGVLISLGIEFALKALIKEYHPKVLVLESIINREAAKELGQRLKRLFKNPEDCLLGITKYSKDPDFIEIKNIEAQQRISKPSQKESELLQACQEASQQELELSGSLEFAVEDELPEDTIKEMEQELANWRQKKENIELELSKLQEKRKSIPETEPLPDLPMKTERNEKIKEKENELAAQIGINHIFRFQNLADVTLVSSCFQMLAEMKSIHASLENRLAPGDERVINDCFKNDLKKQMKNITDYPLNFHNFDTFKKNVLETSLISTIYSSSHPEIGKLFHLPEMDPNIVHEFDKKIVSSCFKKIIGLMIRTFDPSLIEKILKEFEGKIPQLNIDLFQEKLTRLEDYILYLLKGIRPAGKSDTEEKWALLQKEYQTAIKSLEKKTLFEEFKTRANEWIAICKIIPWNIASLIEASLKVWTESSKKDFILQLIGAHSRNLDELYDFLLNLKDLKKNIMKQERINEAFKSVEIAADSIDDLSMTIKNRINKVREIYGKNDWDRRVAFMKEKFEINAETEDWIFPLLAYLFIEPDISYEIKVNSYKSGVAIIKFIINKDLNLSNKIQFFYFDSIFDGLINFSQQTKFEMKKGRIEIYELTDCRFGFRFSEHFVDLFNEPLLVNRALHAAAFLNANGK